MTQPDTYLQPTSPGCDTSNYLFISPSLFFSAHRCAVIPDVPGDLTFHFSFRAIEGRYVTVRLPGSGRTLCLCEFEVFIGDNGKET